MRLLLTWFDRGTAGPQPAHRASRPDPDETALIGLLRQPDLGPHHRVCVLCTSSDRAPAQGLVDALLAPPSPADASLLPLPTQAVSDPSSPAELVEALGALLPTLPRPCDLDVVVGSGVGPEARARDAAVHWLHARGLLDLGGPTRLLQLRADGRWGDATPRPAPDLPLVLQGDSPAAAGLRSAVAHLGPTAAHVLLEGPPGSGAADLARALHARSPRASRPLVSGGCAHLSEDALREALLGGGPASGWLAQAAGGSLSLAQAHALPEALAAPLLAAAAERDVRLLVGAEGPCPLQLGAHLRLPALAERAADLPLLVSQLLDELGGQELRIAREVWRALDAAPWSGGLPQLRAEVRRWVLTCAEAVDLEDLSPGLRTRAAVAPGSPEDPAHLLRPLSVQVADLEARALRAVLAHTEGNKSAAARLLDVDRNTLKRKLRALGPELSG